MRKLYQVQADVDWVAVMNDMRGNTENQCLIEGNYQSFEDLMAFMNSCRAPEPYLDEDVDFFNPGSKKQYHKTFKKDTPFEWLNPLEEYGPIVPDQPVGFHGHGVFKRVTFDNTSLVEVSDVL